MRENLITALDRGRDGIVHAGIVYLFHMLRFALHVRGEGAKALSCFGHAIDSVKNGAFDLKWCFDDFVRENMLTYAVQRFDFPEPSVFIRDRDYDWGPGYYICFDP